MQREARRDRHAKGAAGREGTAVAGTRRQQHPEAVFILEAKAAAAGRQAGRQGKDKIKGRNRPAWSSYECRGI